MADAYGRFRDVVRAFPDYLTLAIECETTDKVVQKWHERDRIPARYWNPVVQAARKFRLFGITHELLRRLEEERAEKRERTTRLTEGRASP